MTFPIYAVNRRCNLATNRFSRVAPRNRSTSHFAPIRDSFVIRLLNVKAALSVRFTLNTRMNAVKKKIKTNGYTRSGYMLQGKGEKKNAVEY